MAINTSEQSKLSSAVPSPDFTVEIHRLWSETEAALCFAGVY